MLAIQQPANRSPTGAKAGQDVTVLFTQDALDADNFSSLVGVCEIVRTLAHADAERRVNFVVDVSCASHDLRLPRYRPQVEAIMLAKVGPARMSDNHGIEFHSTSPPPEGYSEPVDKEIVQDTLLIQDFLMAMMHEVVRSAPEMCELIRDQRVRLSYVRGEITEQGLWTPLVPNTFLFYSAALDRMRTHQEVLEMTAALETAAWQSAGGEGSDWSPYFSPPEEGKSLGQRMDPAAASAHPRVCAAMGALRLGMREHLAKEVAACRALQERAGVRAEFVERGGRGALLERMAASDDILALVCAPAGFTWRAYLYLRERGVHTRVRLVTGCALTWDGSDNPVGYQWNEYLDREAMTRLLEVLQEDGVPSVFTPTQVFKHPLKRMDNEAFKLTSTELSTKFDALAKALLESESGIASGSGFTVLGYQGLWNAAKGSPQAIFDPLSVFLTLLFVRTWLCTPEADALQYLAQKQFQLLPCKLRCEPEEGLKIDKWAPSPERSRDPSVFVPDIFEDADEWWQLLEKAKQPDAAATQGAVTVKVKLKSPFANHEEEKEFMAAMDRWYALPSAK